MYLVRVLKRKSFIESSVKVITFRNIKTFTFYFI
nr:MAG TPA: hypothetical protein [Caudoviricetes sp.]